MDYIKETLQKELRSVTRDIDKVEDNITYLSSELKSAEERKDQLTNAKQQLIITLSADTLKPLSEGNACDICGGHLEVVDTFNLPGKDTTLKDERCPCCG